MNAQYIIFQTSVKTLLELVLNLYDEANLDNASKQYGVLLMLTALSGVFVSVSVSQLRPGRR